MKRILLVTLIAAISIHTSFAEPGKSYILTGKEKSIEEIVQADMEKYPDLYKGESLKFYITKFKQNNNLGKRKLAPGDELFFPETKASIKAKKVAQRQHLIGRWRYEQEGNPQVLFITEYKADGTFTLGRNEEPTYSGTWELKDEYLHVKITVNHFRKLFQQEKKPIRRKIILISETELKTQVKGQKVTTGKKVI